MVVGGREMKQILLCVTASFNLTWGWGINWIDGPTEVCYFSFFLFFSQKKVRNSQIFREFINKSAITNASDLAFDENLPQKVENRP